jgi:hypothetical protein
MYFVVTTLTTVGYGDYKGYTTPEYIFTYVVEFAGILLFAIILSALGEILDSDDVENGDLIENMLEDVDVWLVKLDNSRLSKQIPKVLYEQIRLYIKESYTFEHKKLIDSFDFLNHLKPNLRFKLIRECFQKPYLDEFKQLFIYHHEDGRELRCGKEFVSYFTAQLYCRVFLAN